jgi:competence protein ComEC
VTAQTAHPVEHEFRQIPPAIAWLMREVPQAFSRQSDRASLWMVASFSAGVALFFAWPAEPPVWTGLALAAGGGGLVALRRRGLAVLGFALLAFGLGHGAAQLRTALVRAPMLHEELKSADIEGLVAAAEKRPAGNHVILTHANLPGFAIGTAPNVRLTVPAAQGLPVVGQRIALRASVGPVGRPVAPDGFQFERFLSARAINARVWPTFIGTHANNLRPDPHG